MSKAQNRMKGLIKTLRIISILLVYSFISRAEGTKELMPTAADFGFLQIWDQNSPSRLFATYDCPADYRLNIKICNAGEKIYLGFKQTDNNVYYRLKDPNGVVVLGPTLIPSSGTGFINAWSNAATGPIQLAGAAGYDAIVFTSTMAGDYSIEFNPNSATVTNITKRVFTYFDATVADAAGNIKLGRLWSKAWDMTTNNGPNQFKAKMYVYASDSIVTSLDFNGMQPFGFVLSCNSKGCTNTGNVALDRQSRIGNTTFPEYKIFLNDPDPACYPTGTFGSLTAPPTVTGCGSNRCINISVDKTGYIEITLDINGIPNYQAGTSDRIISANVVKGINCIPWDGRDGLGNIPTNGITIGASINYFNGLTHLPLYDVEDNHGGYIVALVRPAGPAPKLFWDDSPIPNAASNQMDGVTNLTGCSAIGCHRWFGRGNNSCVPVCPETVNTWWYADEDTASLPYFYIAITADANTTNPPFQINDITVCANTSPWQLNGGVTGATGGVFSTLTGGTFPGGTGLNGTYSPTSAEISAGLAKLLLTTTGNPGGCPGVTDTLKIHITPVPTVNAGADQTVCVNNSLVTLAGSKTVATGAVWSGGAGTFSPDNTTLNATYKPSAAELSSGSPITLTLTTTGNGLCNAVSDQMQISFKPSPVASAGLDKTVCANSPSLTLSGSVTNATGGTWTGGTTASFNPGRNTLNATYTLTPAEISAGSLTLYLTTTGLASNCIAVTDTMVITVIPAPVVDAGVDKSVCINNASLVLNGSVTNAPGGTWTGGTGTFAPNASTLNATYTLSAAEKVSGVTLTLTNTGAVSCLTVSDAMAITISSAPDATVSTKTVSVCSNNMSVALGGTVVGATGGTWTGGSGTFVPNANTINVTYTPSASEALVGLATLILNTTGNGNCNADKDTTRITILPAPTVNAGVDQTLCGNKATISLSGTVSAGVPKVWSPGGSTSLTPTYIPSAAEIASGSITFTLTANKPSCLPVSDQVTVTFTPSPTIEAGPNQTVCKNNAAVSLSGSATVATGGTWSGGAGTFNPSANSLIATYTPTAAEITAGTPIKLFLTSTGNANCNAVKDSMTVSFSPSPTVNAGPAQSVCGNNANVTLNGSVTVATGGLWSGGLGTFAPNRNTLNATYTPSASEISAGTVTLTLLTSGNGTCNPVSSNMTITITPKPVPNAGSDKTVCADHPAVSLSGTVSVTNTGDWSGGLGSFSPSSSSLNTTYTPSASEILNGSVILTLTSTNNNKCNSESDQVLITITPAPTINAGPDQTICGATTSVSLNGTVTGSTGGVWSSGGTGTFSPNAGTLNASYTPSMADKGKGSVTLTLTSTGNGLCNAISDNMVITFTGVPTINAGPDMIVCTNKLPIKLSAIGSPAVWTGGSGTFSPNANTLNADYTPSAAEISAGTVTLQITTIKSGSCPPVSDQITYTIPIGPSANAGPNQTICGNLPTVSLNGTFSNTGGGSASGVTWSTNGTGTFSSLTIANPVYTPSAADKASGSVTLTITTAGNGSCIAASDQVVINFTPVITVNAGADQSLCSNNSVISLKGSVINATGGIWSGGSGSFAPSNTSLNATYTPTASEISLGSVTLTLTSQGNGTCAAQTDNVTFTFTPGPTVNAGPDQTICGDVSSITLNGSVTVSSGAIWTSTGSGTYSPNSSTLNASYFLSAADITAGKVKFALTTSGNGTCNAILDSMILTITPKPTINAGPDQTVCADIAGVQLNGSKTVATTGTWTSSSGTGTFSPSATTLNATYIPSSTDISNGTVSLKLTSSGAGTCLNVNDVMVITITPAPTVNAGPNLNLCSDVSSVNLNGIITVATGGTWSTTGSGTFGNINAASTVYTPSATDRTSPSVTLTLTTTGNGTCIAKTSQTIISFTPKPTVNAGPDQTICSDSADILLTETITSATGGIWSSSGTGAFSPSTVANNPKYIPSSTDRNLSAVTLTLTTTGNGPCTAVSDQMIINITPAPTVNAGPDQIVCSTSPSITLNATKTVASGILWKTSGTGTFSPNATTLNASYNTSANDKIAGTVTLTATTTGNGTCKTVSDQMVITITPTPIVNAGPDQTVCGDVSKINLNGAVTNATGSSWTTNGAGNFLPDISSLVATYFPTPAELTGTTITFTLTSSGSGICSAGTDQVICVITPKPTVDAGPDQTVCSNVSGVNLNGVVTSASGGKWVSSGTGGFAPNANTLAAKYIPSAADITSGNVILKLTSTGIGTCNPVSDSLKVTFSPIPSVNAGPDITACADADGISLSGTVINATGGIWSTNGSGVFSPNNTSLNATYSYSASDITNGSATLTLTTTGTGACNAVSDNIKITITPAPTVNAGPDVTVCVGTTNIPLNGIVTVATGGSWITLGTGTFVPNENTLNASYAPSAADAAAGSVTLALVTTGNGSCNFYSDNLIVNFGTPSINAGPDQTVCTTNYPVQLDGSGTTGVWSGGGGTFSPNANTLNALYTPTAGEALTGFVNLTLTTTNNGVCVPGVDNVKINIVPGPTANAGTGLSICANKDSVQLNGAITAPATSGLWSTSGNGTFIPNATTLNAYYKPSAADKTAGGVTLTLTTQGNGICNAVTSTVNLTITPAPAVNAGFDQILCVNAPNTKLNGSSVPAGAIWTTNGTGSFSPANTSLNGTYVPSPADITSGVILTLTIPGSATCNAVTDNMNISYTPAPTVNAGNDTTICADIAGINLNGIVTIASGGLWTSSGSGTFSPASNNLTASYTFSASDLSLSTITLTLASTGNGSCNAVSDNKIITINPKPTVNAGSNQTVCGNNAVLVLNGSYTLASGSTWTSSGSGSFSSSNSILNPTYTPSNADIAAGAVNFTLTTIPNPATGCKPVSDVTTVTISSSPTASVNAGFDKTVCEDATSVSLNGVVTVAGGGAWSVLGGTGTFNPGINNLNASYIPTAADKSSGSVNIVLTTILNGTCNPVSDTMMITFTPAPTVNANVDQLVCADTAGVVLNGSVTVATGGIWTSSGTGIFAPNSASLNATYIPSAFDIATGSAGLTLKTTGNGTCNQVSDFMFITINKKPLPNAGPDKTVCSDVTSIPLSGTISFATAGKWTTSGSGTFSPNSTTLNASYLPSPADIASTKVNLTLTATDGSGLCRPGKDQISIFFTPIPTVNAGTDQTVCADLTSISVNGAFSIATGGTWTTTGSGTFANPNLASTTYTPSDADTASGIVKLVFTTTGNGTCKPVKDTVSIIITPKPIANAGIPISCVYSAGVPLSGSVLIATGGHWTSSGTGNFSLNSDILNPSYYPSAADISAGGVTITLTTTGNGTCLPVSATTTIDLRPLPVANAGIDQFICRNSSSLLTAQTFSNVTYQWSTLSGTTIGNNAEVNISASTDTIFILTVTDTKGCFSRDSIKVFMVDPPVLALPSQYCFANFLSLNSHPSNISPGGLFQWFRNGSILTGMNDSITTITQSGNYLITYSMGSCTYSATTIVSDPPVMIPHGNQITCIGNAVSLNANTTSAPVTYSWTAANGSPVGTPNSTSNPIGITALADTNYYFVNVTSTFTSCSAKDSFMVIGIPVPNINISDTSVCQGQIVRLIARPNNIANLDSLNPVYQWKYNGTIQSSVNDTLFPSASGSYNVTVTIGSCSNSDNSTVTMNPNPDPIPQRVNFCNEAGGVAVLDAGNPGSTYHWLTPGNDPTQTITVNSEGTYHVVITNQFNCVRNDSVHLRNTCPPHVYVPNTMTPDCNDCGNTDFKIWGTNFTNLETFVFNRWGEIIFHSQGKENGWDGKYRGEPMPIGSYVWLITYEGVFEEYKGPYKDKGNITIIR